MKMTLRLMMLLGLAAGIAVAGVGAPTTHAQDAPNTFRGGAGKAFHGPVELRAGLLILRARHSGTGNFTVSLELPKDGVAPDQGWETHDLMINSIGQYNGASAIGVRQDGSYLIAVEQASGAYQITIEQPTDGPAETANQRDFDGKGQQVTPIFYLPAGTITVTLTHEGSTPTSFQNFNIALFDMYGGAVQGDYAGRFLSVIGPYSGSVTLDIVIEGFYLFAVDHDGSNTDGRWTIHVDGP